MTDRRSTVPRLDTGRLLLTPEDPTAAPSSAQILSRLHSAGLLGMEASSGERRFSAGERLFEYIAFTGCAVQLDSAASSTPGLSIAVDGPFDRPQLRCGRNSRPPQCPECRAPLTGWRAQYVDLAAAEVGDSIRLSCARCGSESPAETWTWGRQAGVGRVFVAIAPIFPGEGRPLPALFSLLEDIAPAAEIGPWRYFYVQDEHSGATRGSS